MAAKTASLKMIGVYLFKDKTGKIIYIGKSANLKARIASYFRPAEILTPFKKALVKNISVIETKPTGSEIEALLLESGLIKKYQPKYNILKRDDASYFYVWLTEEELPRLKVGHKPRTIQRIIRGKPKKTKTFVGPFTDGRALKNILRLLRPIFPYRTCKNPVFKPCVYFELNLCPAHLKKDEAKNSKTINDLKNNYHKNLRNIFAILRGKKNKILNDLKREMRFFAFRREYEKAGELKECIQNLENVLSHARVFQEEMTGEKINWKKIKSRLKKFFDVKKINRLEGYDASSFAGNFSVGAISVFINGKPAKSEYRKFKIKNPGRDDLAMLKEIILRRLKHNEWLRPEIMLIDGGKGQLSAAMEALKEAGFSQKIKMAALAKKEEILYLPDKKILLKNEPLIYPVLARLRDEAHRFAVAYHRKKRWQGLRKE